MYMGIPIGPLAGVEEEVVVMEAVAADRDLVREDLWLPVEDFESLFSGMLVADDSGLEE